MIRHEELAAGMRTVSRGFAQMAAALDGSGDDDAESRKAAAMRRFPHQSRRIPGLNQAQASAAFSENGLSPKMFGMLCAQALLIRIGDQRYLTEKGRKWLKAWDAEHAGGLTALDGVEDQDHERR